MFTQHKAVDSGGIQANLASQNGAEAGRVQTGAGANHTATVQAGFAPDDLGHCVAGVGNVDNNAIKASLHQARNGIFYFLDAVNQFGVA